MQARIEAMIAAVGTVQPPLQKFYDLLNDKQKAQLNALGLGQRRAEATKSKNGSVAADQIHEFSPACFPLNVSQPTPHG